MMTHSQRRRRQLLRDHFSTATPLKAQRLAARLSVEELAKLAGCSASTVVRAEAGHSIDLTTALALADSLRVPLAWLWPDSNAALAIQCACGGHLDLEAA